MFHLLTDNAQQSQQPALRAVTNRIEAVGGINMSQGKCALPVHPLVKAASVRAVQEGWNTATLRNGTPLLRQEVILRAAKYNNLHFDLDQIAVTHGVTGALEVLCRMFIQPGDEVVLFRPAFPYYERMVRLRGGVPKYVALSGDDWTWELAELEAAFSDKTKLVIFCTPSNPTGKVFNVEELLEIGRLCHQHDAIAISDEVYEYHMGEGKKHISLASLPHMFERTITLSSVSKTFYATGWRIGWAIGPAPVIEKFSIHSDQLFLCANSVMQHAAAYAYQDLPCGYFDDIPLAFNHRKRLLQAALEKKGFRVQQPDGGYFLMADYDGLGFENDHVAVDALIAGANIGAAPGYSFEPAENSKSGYLRFSCAITDLEMECAIQSLDNWTP